MEGAGQPLLARPVGTGRSSGEPGKASWDTGHGDASSGSRLLGVALRHGAASGGGGECAEHAGPAPQESPQRGPLLTLGQSEGRTEVT